MTCTNDPAKNATLAAAVLRHIRFLQHEFQKAERSHRAGARDDMDDLLEARRQCWELYDKLQLSAVE